MTRDADAIVDLYERNAARYDVDRPRALIEKAWLDRMLALAPPPGAILDIGCGVGEPIARYMIARGFAVTGVDSSPAMIAFCRSRLPRGDWRVADMRALRLGRRFDGLLAWDSFFHLTRAAQRAMFPIFAAHAAPAAPLMFTSGVDDGEAIGAYCGEPLYHASLSEAEYRRLLDANGFDVMGRVVDDPACGRRTVWLARRRA